MTKNLTGQFIFGALILLLQVLLLKNIQVALFDNFSFAILLYPLIIISLPLSFSKYGLLGLAFAIGLFVDMFYNSPGVHTSALVFTAYCRSFILRIIEPRGGYRADNIPSASNYGLSWYMSYAAVMLGIHILFYFSMDAFSFVYIIRILVNSLVSFILSYIAVILTQMITNS
jgi:hypothetical protein